MAEFVAITNQGHAESEAGEGAEKSDHGALTKKNPNDLGNVCAERFHDPDLAPLLHGDGDERAHDSERRDDDDKEKQKKHLMHVILYLT